MSSVLIIGASSDMAKAVARKYAAEGYDLLLAGRNLDELALFATDIRIRYSVAVESLSFDVLDFESHQTFYEGIETKPEGVVVAVGYLGDQALSQKVFSEAQLIINTNYTGIVSILNIIADDFETRKHGFVIGISSVAGDRGRKSNYQYGSAKAALTAYLSGLRNRLYASKVHVLTVKPGFVNTQMTQDMDLPAPLTLEPESVAEDIYKAQQKQRDILYTKWIWRWIMKIIVLIPELVFKRLSL